LRRLAYTLVMAEEKSGDQTEEPTQQRLRDARKDGDVPKSKELTNTMLVLCWLVLASMAVPLVSRRLLGLFQGSFDAIAHMGEAGQAPLRQLWLEAFKTLLLITLPLALAASAIGVMTEFLQVGVVFALKRVTPKMDHMNPATGIKRMFSQESLVEVLKSLFKTAALIGIFTLVLLRVLPEILRLPLGFPADVAAAHWHVLMWVGIWAVCVFLLLSALDALYQRYAYIKKLRMSRRDIKQEMKNSEGDPMLKGQRRHLHQEWGQQNMKAAVRNANAVVVNPEHIAVAILYEPGTTDLPVVCAKGEDYEAQLIREAAEEAGVPIMRNVELARGLHENVGLDEYISAEFFQAVAELLRWAESIRGR
jgi:type III secretion protein U